MARLYRLLWMAMLLVVGAGNADAQSYERLSGWCESGGQVVMTDGRPSTTKVQRSYPSCVVTIYTAGTTTPAAIASDYAGTPKANPFTGSSVGYWDFFALDGRYDVVLSGGGLTAPVTLPGLWIRSAGGGGGSGITGSGTANRLPKFATSTSVNDSILQQIGASEIKFTSTGKRFNLDTGSQQVIEIANEAITGTLNDRLAILTGAPSTVQTAGTSNTTGLIGIVTAGGGTTGNAQIAVAGIANCEFDGGTGAGQYVVASATTGGKCTVTSTWPINGRQVIGRVLSTNASSGTYAVQVFGAERRGFQTIGGTTTNVLWNNAGSIAGDSGFTYDITQGLVTLGVSSGVTGQLQLKNINNTFTTTLQPGTTGSNITLTLPSSLPASGSECLQVSSTGTISRTGAACGSGGGGGITGSGTANRFPLWTAATTQSDSVVSQVGISELKFISPGKRINLDTGSQIVSEIPNDTTTGTINDRLVKLTGAPSKVITTSISDTTGIIGVVAAGGGTAGNAQVITEGIGNCEFDGGTTAGLYVIASTTLPGRCTVTSSWPTSPIQVLGKVLTTNAVAGTYGVLWFGQERRGFQIVGGTTTNVLWNNAGAISGDSGFTYDVSTATVTIGQGGISNGLLSLRNATNSNNTTLKAGVPSSAITFTLPANLPVSAGCLQVSSTGVITQTGVACGSGSATNLRQALNVKLDYGCVGDGVTSDQTCLQNAINDGIAAGGKSVYLPAGTYLVTGLSIPSEIILVGDGDKKSIISSTTNATIVSVTGASSTDFRGPTIEDIGIRGDVTAGSSQIALSITDASFVHSIRVNRVTISNAGGVGLSLGKVFSSNFSNMFITNCAGFPFLYDSLNQPGNYFESIYIGDLRASAPTGFRIKAGDFVCRSCNGINNIVAGSQWMVIGKKNGTDGDIINASAVVTLYQSNIESWTSTGIRLYHGSSVDLLGRTSIAGDSGTAAVNKFGIFHELNQDGIDFFAEFIERGQLDELADFADGLTAYNNSQPIQCNGFCPFQVTGQGAGAGGATLTTYRNVTGTQNLKISRADGRVSKQAITATTTISKPGGGYYEVDSTAGPVTLTLEWAGWHERSQTPVIVKDIGGLAATNNITIAGGGGGTVGSGTYVINQNNGAVLLVPDGNTAVGNWRVVAGFPLSGGGGTITGTGTSGNLTKWTGASSIGNALFTESGTTISLTGQQSITQSALATVALTVRSVASATSEMVHFQNSAGLDKFGVTTDANPYWRGQTVGVTLAGASAAKVYFDKNAGALDNQLVLSRDGGAFQFFITSATDGTAGQCLQTNGSKVFTFGACGSGTPAGANTQIQYNNAGAFGASSDFTWNNTTKILTVDGGNASVRNQSASPAASGGGFIMPDVGGSNSDGPAIRWGGAASYANQSSIWISNGFNFQGRSSAGDPLRLRKGTGTSSDGDVVFDLRPSDGRMTINPVGTGAGQTSEIRFQELAANGTEYVALKAPDAITTLLVLTLPDSLPASGNECLQVSNAGVISRTGSACGSGGGGITGSGATGQVTYWTGASVVSGENGLFWDATNDRLGIGIGTSPSVPLHVLADTSNQGLRVKANAATINVDVTADGSTGIIGTTTNHGLDLYTNTGTAIHIDGGTARLVGVNSSSPGAQLDVTSTGAGTIAAQISSAASPTVDIFRVRRNTQNVLTIAASGALSHAAQPRTSGSAAYFQIVTPADTTLAAATEAIGAQFGGTTAAATVTRQFATGAIATQRENVFVAPTYSFVGASTITTACTLCVTGAPIAGPNTTITNSRAIWAQAGLSQFDGGVSVLALGGGGSVRLDSVAGFGGIWFGSNTASPSTSNYTFLYDSGTAGAIVNAPTGGYINFRINNNVTSTISIDSNNRLNLGRAFNASASAQLHVISSATTLLAEQVESASGATVALSNLIHTSDQTAAIRTHTQFYTRSSGTAAAGLGGRLLLGLESSTTNDQDAIALDFEWLDATHASRTGKFSLKTVTNAGALTEAWGVQAAQNYGSAEVDKGNVTGAVTVNLNDGNQQKMRLTGNITLTITNVKPGATYRLTFIQDGTGSRTTTTPSNLKNAGGAITLTGAANAQDDLICTSDGTNLRCGLFSDVK